MRKAGNIVFETLLDFPDNKSLSVLEIIIYRCHNLILVSSFK